ncbi:MAG TPA: MscL family protein [Candidatus Paceibacterota bacterium]
MREFVLFIREQGVVGLAIGFILGGAISSVVASLVKDIIQPAISLIVSSESITTLAWHGISYGLFLEAIINFIILAAVIFFLFKKINMTKLDVEKKN